MELTVYLSRVFGITLVIVGVAIAARRHYFVPVFDAFVHERLTRVIVATIQLIAGLFLVMAHNLWTTVPASVISFIGWMAVIEGTASLVLPDTAIANIFRAVNRPGVYLGAGALAALIGVYLAGVGFSRW